MKPSGKLHRVAAFTTDARGGNPAGVWVDDALPDAREMQRIAADVGYSETAFVAPARGHERTVRYFSPEAEVPFCGHATIATGFILGTRNNETTYRLSTAVGVVPVRVRSAHGDVVVSLTSVDTQFRPVADSVLGEFLAALQWQEHELDTSIAPAFAYAGAWHLIVAAARRDRLAALDYDFDAVKALMHRETLTTLQLIWRERDEVYHARNPFPPGGVVEDPATGAAAAALGGYLRDAGYEEAPFDIEVRQGEDMGNPSRIEVSVPATGGIVVSGRAAMISRAGK